jgi:predicted phosphodiesterase
MQVLLCGDVHGEWGLLYSHIEYAVNNYGVKAVIQCGDFGFYPDNFARYSDLRFPVPVFACVGNHEGHDWLYHHAELNYRSIWPMKHNLFYQPKVSIMRLASLKIGFIGGALNVDRPQSAHSDPGMLTYNWSNFITKEDVCSAERLFNKHRPMLIVSHSCPCGIGIGIPSLPEYLLSARKFCVGHGHTPEDDCGDLALTDLWNRLEFKPKIWAFGHMHIQLFKAIDGVKFYCTNLLREDVEPVFFVLDTHRHTVDFHKMT